MNVIKLRNEPCVCAARTSSPSVRCEVWCSDGVKHVSFVLLGCDAVGLWTFQGNILSQSSCLKMEAACFSKSLGIHLRVHTTSQHRITKSYVIMVYTSLDLYTSFSYVILNA